MSKKDFQVHLRYILFIQIKAMTLIDLYNGLRIWV
jgi:hypothetical protein